MRKKSTRRVVKIVLISLCSLIVAVFASLFLISGVFETPKYLEPWQKTYAQKFNDPRIQLTAVGLLAANGHNMQPWLIQLDKTDPNVFYLYADSSRMTNEVDPDARQMMITQGTFLEYVAVAGDEFGYKTKIELFPDGNFDEKNLVNSMKAKPVAKISLTKTAPATSPLYDYMFIPDTNRAPYKATQLTSDQAKNLQGINIDGNMTLEIIQDKTDLNKLGHYAMQSATIEAGVDRVMQETADVFRSNEYQKNKYRYGFSVEGQGTSGIMLPIIQGLVTVFPSFNSGKSATDLFISSTKASVDSTPAYAMIITKDNNRASQVASGMLYSRLILSAHSMGFVMQPLSQALEEYPEMNEVYHQIHNDYAQGGGTIQMLVRLGEPTKGVLQSMRRDVTDLIRKD